MFTKTYGDECDYSIPYLLNVFEYLQLTKVGLVVG